MNTTRPVYLIAGGRPRNHNSNDSILRAVLSESGKKAPSIAYSGTANGDDTGFFHRIESEFKKAGAGAVAHAVIDSRKADLEKARSILDSADIIFISGGDVERGMDVLLEKDMVGFLATLYRQGKPFFGISAGAIMLADKWVRWPDPDDSEFAELFPCLGFAPVICDCHDEEGGWEELQAALALEKEKQVGYGLASGSGIKVDSEGRVEAFGAAVHRYIRQGNGVARTSDIIPL